MKKRSAKNAAQRKISLRDIPFQTIRTVMLVTAAVFLLLSITLSINLFVTANRQADQAYILEQAVSEATTIAETLKSSNGDLALTVQYLRNYKHYRQTDDSLLLFYDEAMMPAAENDNVYQASVSVETFPAYKSYKIRISETDTNTDIYVLEFKFLQGGGIQ